jgi:hypothetical protein
MSFVSSRCFLSASSVAFAFATASLALSHGLMAQIPASGIVTDASGVNIHFTHPQEGELEMIRAAGFKWIRMDLTWEATERKKGVYDFAAYDHLMKSLEAQGLRAVFILNYSNKNYEPLRSITSEEGKAAYARWAVAAVQHYRGKGVIWEIWNEPNIEGFWKPKPDVEAYVKMARVGCQAIKEAAPDECVVGPASSTIDLEFLEGCFKGGLLEWWQAVSVHPYRQGGPESVAAEYHALRQLIGKHAPAGKKVAVLAGEWGYSEAWSNFDASLQGKMLTRQWVVNAASAVPVSIWYDWKDDGPDPKEAEHRFGTVERQHFPGRTAAYNAKPAYLAAQTFNRELEGFHFVKRINLGNLDHHGYLFERAGAQCLVAWTAGGVPASVKVRVSPGTISAVGHLGQVLPPLSGGELQLALTDAPVYVKFQEIDPLLRQAMEAVPMKLTVLPCAGDRAAVQVTTYGEHPVTGKVKLIGMEGLEVQEVVQSLKLAPDQAATTVLFPLKASVSPSYRLGAELEVNGQTLLTVPARHFVAQPAELANGLRTFVTGDDKVSGKAELSRGTAPIAPPVGSADAWRLKCTFGAGWKFAQIIGAEGARYRVAGGPEAGPIDRVIRFGMWVHGDNSKTALRLRLQDAAGRTWQSDGPNVNWTGWRFVEFKLDERTSHWGGNAAGAKDAPAKAVPVAPLIWDTVLLLDNPARTACEVEIWFQPPLLLEE